MPQDIENSKFRIRLKKLEDKISNISDTGLSASYTYLTGTYFTSSQSFIDLLTASNLSSSQLTASSIFTNNFTIQKDNQINNLYIDDGTEFTGISIYDSGLQKHILSCISSSGAGKVGILRTDPVYTFDVSGTLRATDSMYVDNNLTVTNNLFVNGNTTLGNASGDVLRITGSANFNNNIVLSNTSGIVFGTIGGSVTSVTLNDYEEGNWTPRFVQSGGTGVYFYQRQSGKYIKIGKLCTVTADIRLTASLPATNGILLIEGLPHTCASGFGYYSQASCGYYQEFKSTITDFPSGYVEVGDTFINLTYPAGGSNTWITNGDLLANGTNYSAIIITVSYITV